MRLPLTFYLTWLFFIVISVNSYGQSIKPVVNNGHFAKVNDMAESRDGRLIATVSNDQTIKIWEVASRRLLANIDVAARPVSVAFSPDNSKVIAGLEDCIGDCPNNGIMIWDIATQKLLKHIYSKNQYRFLKIIPGSNTFVAGKRGVIYRLSDYEQEGRIQRNNEGVVLSEYKGQPTYAYASLDKLLIYAVGNSAPIETRALPSKTWTGSRVVAISDDYSLAAYFNKKENLIKIVDTKKGSFITEFDAEPTGIPEYQRASERDVNAGFTPDNSTFIITNGNTRLGKSYLTFMHLDDQSVTRVENPHPDMIGSIFLTKNSKFVLTNAGGRTFRVPADNSVKIWSIETGKQVGSLENRGAYITSVEVTSEGKSFVTGSSGSIIHWNTDQMVPLMTNSSPEVQVLDLKLVDDNHVISSYETYFAAKNRSTSQLDLWNLNTGEKVRSYNLMAGVRSFDMSRELGRIVALDSKNMLYGWNMTSEKSLFQTNLERREKALSSYAVAINEAKSTVYIALNNSRVMPAYNLDGTRTATIAIDGTSKPYESIGFLTTRDRAVAVNGYAMGILDTNNDTFLKYLRPGNKHSQSLGRVIISGESDMFLTGVGSEDEGSNHAIVARDGTTYETIREYKGHKAAVRDAAFLPSGENFISVAADGSIGYWDAGNTEPLTMTYSSSVGEFITVTNDNYYYASKNAFDLLHFVADNTIYTFDQFDLIYNRPDIVLSRIGRVSSETVLAYKKAWEKRIDKMGFQPADFDGNLSLDVPDIALEGEIEPFATTTNASYTYTITAEDNNYNLERLLVEVNGVPLYGVRGKDLSSAASKTTKQTIELTLSSGTNVITTSVLNERGVESLSERFEVTYTPPKPIKPNLHIIAIGVSKFEQSDFNLTYADKDARDLISTLQKNSGDYGEIFVHPLTNEQATKANVLALREELEKTRVDDEVVVFAATHGLLDEDLDYYLAMHNTDFANPADGGLRYDELENLIDAIPARNKLMLLDACHSGEVDKEETEVVTANNVDQGSVKSRGFKLVKSKSDNGIGLKSSFELMKELFADLRRNNGAVVISSASGQEYAFESPEWKNGVFTYSLLRGLQTGNADTDNNGKVQVSELREYVSRRVQELTDGKQNPTSRAVNLENDFVVWR